MVQYAPGPIARERKPLPSLEDIQASRKIAEAMMQEGSSYAPVGHWTQGAARVAQALVGSMRDSQARKDEGRLQGDANDAYLGLMGGPRSVTGGMPPVPQQAVQAEAEPPMTPDQQGVAKFAQPNLMQGRVASALDPSLVNAVKGFEGYTPKSQWDYKQHSVGYGTRGQPGETIDQPEAERRLAEELTKAQGSVNSFAPNAPDGVRKALTSLTFNAGDKWQRSGLGSAVQNGDMTDAKNRFLQYNKAGGQTLPGLVNRRQQEAQWFDQQPQAQQGDPQQLPQTADASQGQGLDRETIARMLANPLTRDMAQKIILQQMPKPADPQAQAELEYKRAQTEKIRQGMQGGGQMQKRQDMLNQMGIDPNSAEGKAVMINGKLPAAAYEQLNQRQLRQTAAPKIDEGLRNLDAMTENYDDASFSNSVGPFQGATPDGLFSAAPINAARLFGETANLVERGGTAPGEVRSNIHGSTEALAAAIKPLIRAPGEGVWTDQDQARLVSVVGDLAQARDKPEFKRRLLAVKERIKANFNLDLSYVPSKDSEDKPGAKDGNAQQTAKPKQMDLGDGFSAEFE